MYSDNMAISDTPMGAEEAKRIVAFMDIALEDYETFYLKINTEILNLEKA